MKFIKKNIKYIGIVIICMFCSYLTTIATNYIFDSSDVRFDNTGTSLESVNVQDAIDETFHHVTDYNEIKTTIGNSSLTTTNKTLIGAINELNGNKANGMFNAQNKYGQDLNNYIETGLYGIGGTGGLSNGPITPLWATLTVNRFSDTNYITQICQDMNSDRIWIRRKLAGTWQSWQELATKSDINTLNSNLKSVEDNFLYEKIKIKQIICTGNTEIKIIGGASFSSHRCPILAYYADQGGSRYLMLIYRHESTLQINVVGNTTITLSASISGNDIIISGIGNWGNGFAIGMR